MIAEREAALGQVRHDDHRPLQILATEDGEDVYHVAREDRLVRELQFARHQAGAKKVEERLGITAARERTPPAERARQIGGLAERRQPALRRRGGIAQECARPVGVLEQIRGKKLPGGLRP